MGYMFKIDSNHDTMSWVPNCYIVKVHIGICFVNSCAIFWVTQLVLMIGKNAM